MHAAFARVLALLALMAFAAADVPAAALQDKEKDEPNPRLVVPPLNEPDMDLERKVAEREDFVAPIQGGGFIFERRDVDGKRIGGVTVPGVVLVTKGLVELFGCGD